MTEVESSWGERGSLTAFFVLLVVAFLLVAGLVYDGGR